jgi:hypothetical protein
MDIREYLASSYQLLKALFSSAEIVEQSIIVGAVREHLAAEVLGFFPEPIRSGWIYDQNHLHTGQIDLILNIWKALPIPGLLMGSNPVSGVFASEVFAAIEVKSGISSSMGKIMRKTWECHRLTGGFGSQSVEEFEGLNIVFEFENWVPLCVIGSDGFKNPSIYQEHFSTFEKLEYSVNKTKIDRPTEVKQVVPDLLLDFTNDTLLVRNALHPELIHKCFRIPNTAAVKYPDFTIFPGMVPGQPLMALLYYIDLLRGDVSICQLTKTPPLLDVFKP